MSDKHGSNFHPRDNFGGNRNRNRSRNRNRDNRRPRRDDERWENRRNDRRPPPGRERPEKGPERKGPPKPAKPTLAQKLLTILTFGLVRPKPGVPPGSARPAPGDKERPRPGRSDRNPRESKPAASLPPSNPDAVETDRLHIGNLSYDASESDLLELFNGVGKVQSVDIVYNGRTHRSKGFGFVQMMSIADAKRAVTELHGKPFMGRPLNLGPARSRGRDEREADDGQA